MVYFQPLCGEHSHRSETFFGTCIRLVLLGLYPLIHVQITQVFNVHVTDNLVQGAVNVSRCRQ